MKFLFLIAAIYLIIEYLNYLRRKENKEEVDKKVEVSSCDFLIRVKGRGSLEIKQYIKAAPFL